MVPLTPHSRSRLPIRPGPVLALLLAAAVAVGLTVGANLTVSSSRLPGSVRLSATATGGQPSSTATGSTSSRPGQPTSSGEATSQPSEPVETLTPPGTVVTLPAQDSKDSGDQQQSPSGGG